jgi:hypothetical protein
VPTKQRFSWLTRDRSSPSARFLAIALLSFVTFACLVSIVYLLARPEPLNPYQQAAELDALIHRDPRFAEVTAQASYPGVIVLVTGQLSDDTRSDLERFVREHAPHLDTPIRYFPTDAELTRRIRRRSSLPRCSYLLWLASALSW